MVINEGKIVLTIRNVEYVINRIPKKRAQWIFEKTSGKFYTEINDSQTDGMILFYSVLVANNKDTFTYSFDEFLDILDECEDNMVQIYTDFVTEGIVEEKVEVPTAKKKVKPQLK